MPVSEICFMTATEIAQRIESRELSCLEVVEAHLAQIERVNPRVNAIVTRIPDEQVLARARSADEALARGDKLGPLHGLPIAHKDLVPTKDLRTRRPWNRYPQARPAAMGVFSGTSGSPSGSWWTSLVNPSPGWGTTGTSPTRRLNS